MRYISFCLITYLVVVVIRLLNKAFRKKLFIYVAQRRVGMEKSLNEKEAELEREEDRLSLKKKKGISESKELLEKLKSLFFKEAEILASHALAWDKKCSQCIAIIEQQNAILRRIKDDNQIISSLAEKSEKVFQKEQVDAYLQSRAHPTSAFWVDDARKLLEAKRFESGIEKLHFLMSFDLVMLIEGQDLRKTLYEKAAHAELDQPGFIKDQYAKLLKDSNYLNEIIRYTLGEENLENYAIFLENMVSQDLKKEEVAKNE